MAMGVTSVSGTAAARLTLRIPSAANSVGEVFVKVVLATCKMYVSLLPEPELALACVVACGGAVLFVLGWRMDQFFEPEMLGAPQLPLKLRANSVQARPQVSAKAQPPPNGRSTHEL